MAAAQELFNIRQASIWATEHIGKIVTLSNITYLLNYGTRISTKIVGQINTDELIYWIDKQFVQETAQVKIGRNLNDEEITQLTKLVENGLWEAVNITLKTAIDEVNQNK